MMIPYVFKHLTALHDNMKLLYLELESTYSTLLLPEYFFLLYHLHEDTCRFYP